MDDFDPHEHYRRKHMDTERIAAESQVGTFSESCAEVLALLRKLYPDGLTDEEGRDRTGLHSYRRRRADLLNKGMVRDSGERRPSSQNKPMAVWVWSAPTPAPPSPQRELFND